MTTSPSPTESNSKRHLFFTSRKGRKNKRYEKVYKDNVNPNSPSSNNYQTQQSHCQECNSTAKDVQYRPLVSENGSYLCNTCYKVKFPATAMYDSKENQNFIVNRYQEYDIRKKQMKLAESEELEGVVEPFGHANNILKNKQEETFFPEEEECSACLDKGIFRKCCKKYYCHTCYYNETKTCPGCGMTIYRSGVSLPKSKPTKFAVLASWGITLSIILLSISIICAFIMHSMHRPQTLWEGTCHGWFPSCDEPICIDVDMDTPIFMPIKYEFCSINTTVNKVIGMGCITDPQLYRESNRSSGFAICLQDSRSKAQTPVSTPSSSSSFTTTKRDFENGIYIFEDNFDYWKNRTNYHSESILMKSARWSYMINGKVSDICGTNDIVRPHEVERPPHEKVIQFKRSSALVFSGVQKRYAETIALDVRYGGFVEFYIKFAPLVDNELVVECKSAFSGDVTFSYSLDNGLSWKVIRTYPVWKYRRVRFTRINEILPLDAQSEHTRFKWEQPVFDPVRDFWALDDIRIFHAFELNWKESDWYLARKSERWNMDQQEQCCLDTQRCLNFPNYNSLDQDCNSDKHNKNTNYRVKIVDMFLIAAAAITLLKKGCHDFQDWNEYSDEDSADEIAGVTSITNSSRAPSERIFPLNSSRSWQTFAFFLLITPFVSFTAILSFHVLRFNDYYTLNSIQTIFMYIAIGLDFWTIRSLSMNVLQYWPFHIQPRIKIDVSKEEFVLWMGNKSIPILDISSIESFTEVFYMMLFASVVVSGMPLGIISILIKALSMKYTQYIAILNIFGCSLILRSILGPKWFVEIIIAMTWIFTPSMYARDDMGRALGKPSVRHVVTNATLSAILLYIILFVTFEPLNVASYVMKVLVFIFHVLLGSIVGSLIGMMRGLPVKSDIHLTTWPSEGFSFVNDRFKKKPRTWAKLFGGGMNSVQIHIIQVQKRQELKELISGSDALEKVKKSKE